MAETLETSEYKLSEFPETRSVVVEKTNTNQVIVPTDYSRSGSVSLKFKHAEFNTSPDDGGAFLNKVLGRKDVILNEKWDLSENIMGIVSNVNDNQVSVDCLVDIENKVFQYRTFPIQLFSNIERLEPKKPVIIKTRMKAGTVRIDVYSGNGIVNEKLFVSNANWDSLLNSGMDNKLTKW